MLSARREKPAVEDPSRTGQTLLWWWQGTDNKQSISALLRLIDHEPIPDRICHALPPPVIPRSCADRVCWVSGHESLRPHVLFLPRAKRYNVEAAYEKSRREDDANLAPHTFFYSLKQGKNAHALEFLNTFGPLNCLDESPDRKQLSSDEVVAFRGDIRETRPIWVDLHDFWEKRQRFSIVLDVWQARQDRGTLLQALQSADNLRIYPGIGTWRLGVPPSLPWHGQFAQWAEAASDDDVAHAASELISNELELNAHDLEIRWRRSDSDPFRFSIESYAPNLWAALWYLFVQDTQYGLGWRSCPHCARLFYPRRKDSLFCDQHRGLQKHLSRNKWWREHKVAELEKRKRIRKAKSKAKSKQYARKKH